MMDKRSCFLKLSCQEESFSNTNNENIISPNVGRLQEALQYVWPQIEALSQKNEKQMIFTDRFLKIKMKKL